jgi:membrane fusion protein (multidrug efflux system)
VRTDDVAIAAKRPGVLREVLVADHETVVAGQVLARLQPRDDTADEPSSLVDIVAPTAGTVAIDDLHIGQAVPSGQPLMVVLRQDGTFVIARLEQSQMAHVAVGQVVTIEAPAFPALQLYGYVADVAATEQAAAPQRGHDRQAVKIVLREGSPAVELRSGLAVRTTINTGLTDAELLTATIPHRNAAKACRAEWMLFDNRVSASDVFQSI